MIATSDTEYHRLLAEAEAASRAVAEWSIRNWRDMPGVVFRERDAWERVAIAARKRPTKGGGR